MSTNFYITSENNQQKFRDAVFKGSVVTYQFDFSQWAEENNTVSTVTWSVESGSATIAGQALSSNVASAQVTLPAVGGNLIKVVADTGTEKYVTFLEILAKDLDEPLDDYGFVGC